MSDSWPAWSRAIPPGSMLGRGRTTVRAKTTVAALACGLGMLFVGVASPAMATETPGPTDVTATSTPTTGPDQVTSTPDTAVTDTPTPTGEPTEQPAAPETTPATEPTDTPDPNEEDPVIIPTELPTAFPTAFPTFPKQPIKLSQTCSGRTGTWTLTNVTTHKVGYAWVDTKLAFGVDVLQAGESVRLGHGFAVLAIALSSKSFLPVNLPLIALSKCGDVPAFGAKAPPASALPISSPGASAAPLPAAPAATPVVTDVHFTG